MRFLIIFLLAQFQIVNAQNKAKDLLDQLSKKNKSYSSIYAKFSFTNENKTLKINETQSGEMSLKGNKFKIILQDNEIYCDGKTQYTFNREANEVQVDNYSEKNTKGISPTNIFTFYEKGFKLKLEKEEKINNKQLNVILLTPEEPKDKNYHSIKLYLSKDTKEINRILIMLKDGGTLTYSVQQYKYNENLADNYFVFDKTKHPKAELIDLR
jgi:outer membrane lipoprotein-sorting protein